MSIFEFIIDKNSRISKDNHLMVYGKFVGSWKVRSIWFDGDNIARSATGEWHFDWILGGLGIQDVLFADDYPRTKYGTTLRCYDSVNDVWHVTWMQPGNNEFAHLIGKKVGAEIIQEILGLQDKKENWIFRDISRNEFTWIAERSCDNGRTWKVLQEMKCERMQPVTLGSPQL